MITLKVTVVGDSAGIILPRETLDKLKIGEGDALILTETPEGFLLRPYDPEFETQIRLAEQVTREYPDTLRELSK